MLDFTLSGDLSDDFKQLQWADQIYISKGHFWQLSGELPVEGDRVEGQRAQLGGSSVGQVQDNNVLNFWVVLMEV